MLCGEHPTASFIDNFSMAACVARDLGVQGYNITFPNACGSGTLAVAVAADLIAIGKLDAVIAAGADTYTESMFGLADRANLRAPRCMAPFDRHRGGPLLGEGAAALILEGETSARERRARVFGEVTGAGVTCDAVSTHKTTMEGVSAAITQALSRSGMCAQDIDYVCAHGTATDVNDVAETRALERVLGARASAIPVSAIKSMLGHTSGASGAVAVVAALLAIEHGIAPPTMNLANQDPELGLNYVPNRAQRWSINTALVNAFGFGGTNACVVLRRYNAGAYA
jgi:3-oxoacyl-[acyl-carrier-protein] synthase II